MPYNFDYHFFYAVKFRLSFALCYEISVVLCSMSYNCDCQLLYAAKFRLSLSLMVWNFGRHLFSAMKFLLSFILLPNNSGCHSFWCRKFKIVIWFLPWNFDSHLLQGLEISNPILLARNFVFYILKRWMSLFFTVKIQLSFVLSPCNFDSNIFTEFPYLEILIENDQINKKKN